MSEDGSQTDGYEEEEEEEAPYYESDGDEMPEPQPRLSFLPPVPEPPKMARQVCQKCHRLKLFHLIITPLCTGEPSSYGPR